MRAALADDPGVFATVAPLWSSPAPAPAHVNAAPMQPFVVKAKAMPVGVTHHVATKSAETPTTHVTDVAPESHVPVVLHHHCTGAGVGVQCSAPHGSTLYVNAGPQAVGLTNDLLPVSCTSLPQTAVTHCEPSDRKN